MRTVKRALSWTVGLLGVIGICTTLFALPAMWTLPKGRRQGLAPMTVEEAATQLQVSGTKGWQLVEAAHDLVSRRMQYSRRNSYDPAARAFDRAYGYCQQMAFALAGLLDELGFEVQVVQALRNRFPDGAVGGHAWVRVTWDGETRHIDALLGDGASGRLDFQPLSRVTEMGPVFRAFAGWGAGALNAYRYYHTGKDM